MNTSNNGTEALLAQELEASMAGTTLEIAPEAFGKHAPFVTRVRRLVGHGQPDSIRELIAEYPLDTLSSELRQKHGLPMPTNGIDTDVEYCTPQRVREFFGNVEWAWPGWLPRGHVTMIAGEQGIGKSFLSAELIARFARYKTVWPNGQEVELPARRVLLVETEQMKGVYAERLEAMGVGDDAWLFGPGSDPAAIPDIVEQHDEIETLARDANAGAVLVDSLSGGHGQKENDAYMRKVLQPLSTIATNLKIPVIIDHHPRKRSKHESSKVTLDRVRGSTTITQFCRSVLGLYRLDGTGEGGLVRVDCIKHNFCTQPEPFGFGFQNDGSGLIFTTAPETEDNTAMGEALEFLQEELSDGRVRSTQVLEDARQAGIAERTLRRAKRKLRAVSDKQDADWYWYLPA